jgi:hypothetical protein
MHVTRIQRWLVAVTAVTLLVAGCATSAPKPLSFPPSPSAGPTATPTPGDPTLLVGLWKLTNASPSQPGEVVRLGDDLTLWSRCGLTIGAWKAGHDGTFVGATHGGAQACSANYSTSSAPAWLTSARSFVIHGTERWLLNASGRVTAKLLPGGKPVVPPTVWPPLAKPPTLTPALKSALKAPTAPSSGGSIPTRAQLLGRWVPYPVRFPAKTSPFASFAESGSWTGSDGCNGNGGRWTLGAKGTLFVLSGPSTLIGCNGAPVGDLVTKARTGRLQGRVLALFDVAGHGIGKLTRG